MIDKVKEVLLAEQELVYTRDWEDQMDEMVIPSPGTNVYTVADLGFVVEPHEFLAQVNAATTIEELREITISCWKENGCEKYQGIRFFTQVLEKAMVA